MCILKNIPEQVLLSSYFLVSLQDNHLFNKIVFNLQIQHLSFTVHIVLVPHTGICIDASLLVLTRRNYKRCLTASFLKTHCSKSSTVLLHFQRHKSRPSCCHCVHRQDVGEHEAYFGVHLQSRNIFTSELHIEDSYSFWPFLCGILPKCIFSQCLVGSLHVLYISYEFSSSSQCVFWALSNFFMILLCLLGVSMFSSFLQQSNESTVNYT